MVKKSNHFFHYHAPLTRLKVAQSDVTNLHTNEAQSRETDSSRHVSHLAVLSFYQSEAHPTRRNVGPIANRRNAFPQIFGSIYPFRLAWFRMIALNDHAFRQLTQGIGRNVAIHLSEISARMLKFRVKQLLYKAAIIGQQQSTFAVVVQTASSINLGREAKLIESQMSCLGRKLAQNAIRLVEKDYHSGLIEFEVCKDSDFKAQRGLISTIICIFASIKNKQ